MAHLSHLEESKKEFCTPVSFADNTITDYISSLIMQSLSESHLTSLQKLTSFHWLWCYPWEGTTFQEFPEVGPVGRGWFSRKCSSELLAADTHFLVKGIWTGYQQCLLQFTSSTAQIHLLCTLSSLSLRSFSSNQVSHNFCKHKTSCCSWSRNCKWYSPSSFYATHSRFISLLTTTSVSLDGLPNGVIQTFIPEGSEPLEIMPYQAIIVYLFAVKTEYSRTKRQPRDHMCIKHIPPCIHNVAAILPPHNRVNYPRQYGNFFLCLIVCWH